MRKSLIVVVFVTTVFCAVFGVLRIWFHAPLIETRQEIGQTTGGEAGETEEGATLDGNESAENETSAESIEGVDAGADEDGGVSVVADANANVETNAFVIRAVDGDTLDVRLDDGEEARVRLLGVNTPETVDPRKTVECFGKEASAFTKEYLNGKRVRLEADPLADERDKYGRLLRNVVLEDGTDFNAELVASGYAYAYTFFPLDPLRKREIIALEKQARTEGVGLWADGACNR